MSNSSNEDCSECFSRVCVPAIPDFLLDCRDHGMLLDPDPVVATVIESRHCVFVQAEQ